MQGERRGGKKGREREAGKGRGELRDREGDGSRNTPPSVPAYTPANAAYNRRKWMKQVPLGLTFDRQHQQR